MSISVVILTKNEEKNIERCLKSISFCDEIIIVDDYSTDRTLDIIKKVKGLKRLRIYQRKLKEDFASQRNFAMKKAKGDWLLFVDADEEVSTDLKEEINEILHCKLSMSNNKDAYYIKRRDWWWGKELKFGETKKIRNKGIVRLVKKNAGKWIGKVHEVFQINGKIGYLNSYLNHYPHPTIKEFISEINWYSNLRANELFAKGIKTNIIEIILYPLAKFILNYFIYLGFLDGPAGFVYAFLMSFHSFLVRTKLYQLGNWGNNFR